MWDDISFFLFNDILMEIWWKLRWWHHFCPNIWSTPSIFTRRWFLTVFFSLVFRQKVHSVIWSCEDRSEFKMLMRLDEIITLLSHVGSKVHSAARTVVVLLFVCIDSVRQPDHWTAPGKFNKKKYFICEEIPQQTFSSRT